MRAAVAAAFGLGILLLGLAAPAVAATPAAHYVPKPGDTFSYTESYIIDNGTGDYIGYTDGTYTNGSVSVTAVASNGTESASYQNTNHYANNTGTSYTYASSGKFTFSADTFHYVNGTDNQTGYTNPYVWFYMNNSLGVGGSFYLLNTPMHVTSTNTSFELASGKWVATIATEGSGSYERDDVYGIFTAAYTWRSYFDPSTGYIVGYAYSETDSNASGDGFSVTDSLSVTSTSYTLTPGSAPASSSSSPSPFPWGLVLVVVVVVIVVIVIVIALARRPRRHLPPPPPRHAATGAVQYTPATGPPPPSIHLTPGSQPMVQQVVVRETVKVNCRYCGTLMDSTATVCPVCGAPRA
jgi:hypothetical protein